ncbi:MAG: PilX N-terminal domain-containing pilus assembly protein [Gammaproteobacteria bacterium]|nr:PilX N-terminal domain-containing pilus assembly protein [Gammaproteobacteria bacterium]
MRSQRGFVLIVSLLILMVITMIGVNAVSTSVLEGRMAHNLQHAMYAFQAAESAIEDTIRASDPFDTGYLEANDPSLAAFNGGIGFASPLEPLLDPIMASYVDAIGGAGVAITTGGSTMTRTGTGSVCPGYSAGEYSCVPFQISAVATINTSNATVNNIQGVERVLPGGL